jgi:hypothetical protein
VNDERRCAICGQPLIRSQRILAGYPENDYNFARRKFCSWQCAAKAQGQAQVAKARAKREAAR